MIVAPSITFFGACQSAIEAYADIFGFKEANVETFREVDDAFSSFVTAENENYILRGHVVFACGTHLMLKDSISLLLDPASGEGGKGTKDGPIIEVYGMQAREIEEVYSKFMDRGSVANFELGPRDGHALHASLIDPFTVCWNLWSA